MSLFIKTDVDIPFVIASGFALTDIANVTVQLEKGEFTLTKSLGSGITIDNDQLVVSISRTEILTTGDYKLYARITDQGGKQRGIALSPSVLTFVEFPIQ